MNLYHYNKHKFKELKSLAAQQNIAKSDITNLPYNTSISFFIEPIPLDILPSIHKNKHNFYVNGDNVYEYTIDINELSKQKFIYHLVESPEVIELYYDETISDKNYSSIKDKIEQDHKYIGNNIHDLQSVIRPFLNKTKDYFKKVPSYSNYKESLIKKYAPCVPHLMIYLEKGIVQYKEIELKTMGHSQHSKLFKKW